MRFGTRVQVRDRAAEALRDLVRRSDDRRLERTVGSRAGLALLFGALARRFEPSAAEGFAGDLRFELRTAAGELRTWTVEVRDGRARARRGLGRPGVDPDLVVKLRVADVARFAAGELDAGSALLTGRLDLEGDWSVAMRLGPMFGAGRLT